MHQVHLIDELAKFKKKVEEELREGRKSHEKEYKYLTRGIEKLNRNLRAGKPLREKTHQRGYTYYSKKHNIDNLRKLDIGPRWRVIYTIVSDKNKTAAFILDSLDHNKYNKVFGYRG